MDFLRKNRRFGFLYNGKEITNADYTVTQTREGDKLTSVYALADGLKITNIAIMLSAAAWTLLGLLLIITLCLRLFLGLGTLQLALNHIEQLTVRGRAGNADRQTLLVDVASNHCTELLTLLGNLAGKIYYFGIFQISRGNHLITCHCQIANLINLAHRINQPDIFQKILFHKKTT